MPEIPNATQQLAALDLVWRLALEHDMNGDKISVVHSLLRRFAEAQQERERRLGQAFALDLGWGGEADMPDRCAEYGATICRAIASVGAEIVWPSPDSAETADRAAGGDTAPETVDVGERPASDPPRPGTPPDWYRTMSAFKRAQSTSGPKPTAREKILAEVAAATATDLVPDFAYPEGILAEAVKFASAPTGGSYDDPAVRANRMRANAVRAAALLVLAVERLDTPDE